MHRPRRCSRSRRLNVRICPFLRHRWRTVLSSRISAAQWSRDRLLRQIHCVPLIQAPKAAHLSGRLILAYAIQGCQGRLGESCSDLLTAMRHTRRRVVRPGVQRRRAAGIARCQIEEHSVRPAREIRYEQVSYDNLRLKSCCGVGTELPRLTKSPVVTLPMSPTFFRELKLIEGKAWTLALT